MLTIAKEVNVIGADIPRVDHAKEPDPPPVIVTSLPFTWNLHPLEELKL